MALNRRNDILKAAGKCFARFGYEKTTIEDIGEMVGMNKVSLYYYFKNKEAIFAEVITREADEFARSVEKKVESITGCREKILAWIKESFNYNQTSSVLHQLSIASLRKLNPRLEELKNYAEKKGTDYLASVLEEYRKKKEVSAIDVKKVARTIQSVIYAMKERAYKCARSDLSDGIDFKAMVEEILFTVSLILDGIVVKNH
jgi:AcrR family transcriptional regulator